ncbi:hypothetical protein [Flavobacterium sp. N1994]|uniref:hypothetical protein n=1 Tax=Flavobacterium sp. N1994 TaxID=2986827 RepID=UPI002223D275|nr:hypothetical protein [Flavobacterium sp. N1994]
MTKAQQSAKEVFERYPNAKEVFVTPDEQAFLDKNRAAMHNSDFETVKRSEVMTDEPSAEDTANVFLVKKLAADKIAQAEEATTIAQLDAIEKDETRTTVLNAVAARRAQLASGMEVDKSEEDLITEISTVKTVEELDAYAKDETRQIILDTIDARRTELTENQD